MYNARLLNDSASEILKYGERKLEEGREEGRLLSIARGLSRSDEKTVRELLDATDDEINAANELLNSGEIEI